MCLTLYVFELYRNKWFIPFVFLLSSLRTVCDIHPFDMFGCYLLVFTADLNYHLGISLVIHFPGDEHMGCFHFYFTIYKLCYHELLCISMGTHQVSVRSKTTSRIIRSEYVSLPLLDNAKLFPNAFVPIPTPGAGEVPPLHSLPDPRHGLTL